MSYIAKHPLVLKSQLLENHHYAMILFWLVHFSGQAVFGGKLFRLSSPHKKRF